MEIHKLGKCYILAHSINGVNPRGLCCAKCTDQGEQAPALATAPLESSYQRDRNKRENSKMKETLLL